MLSILFNQPQFKTMKNIHENGTVLGKFSWMDYLHIIHSKSHSSVILPIIYRKYCTMRINKRASTHIQINDK